VKIALKYGIAVTIVIAAWVALKHFVLHLEGQRAQVADIVIFNLAAIVGLVLGIRAKRTINGGWLTFVEGWKTGVSIAVTYALLTSLYFAVVSVIDPSLMKQEGETSLVKAFAGVSVVFTLFGTVFSAIISVILKKKPVMGISE
jgi:hypothetical protein